MTVEMNTTEAELLIAALAFAEGAALEMQSPLVGAIKDLRPVRSALLGAYLRERLAQPDVAGAVARTDGRVTG